MSVKKSSMSHIANIGKKNPELEHLADPLAEACGIAASTVRNEKKILAAGNGGSCSDALHFSGELLKSFLAARPLPGAVRAKLLEHAFGEELASSLEMGIPVIVLGQNPALGSAYLNDRKEVRAVLAQECLALACPGDLLIVFSTSGEAENLLWAMAAAKARGARTLAFTGKSGGKLGKAADLEIRAPGQDTPTVQEQHIILYHALCAALEEELFS